jgi:hypothetical protein
MHKTQIMISETQMSELRKLAGERGVSVAQIIREALEDSLTRWSGRDMAEVRQRAARVSGRFHSGRSDVSVNHDEHLAEAYRQ